MASETSRRKVSVLILGAGPTGLGAATRLHQHDRRFAPGSQEPSIDWLLVDKVAEAGGLACTDKTEEGFLFDMGGHVIFSHYQYFDDLIDAAMAKAGIGWNTHQRVSYVWLKGRFVAYPFQNNIAALDKEDQIACLNGVIEAQLANALAKDKPANFDEWILRVMGQGIADIFMRPYNFKVWAVPTTEMQCDWLGERVATVDVKRAINNVIHNKEDAGWGPNAVFRFPQQGGTGAIWKAVAELLPKERQLYGAEATSIDLENRTVSFKDGSMIEFDHLVSTVPLDITLRWTGREDLAQDLTYSSSHIVGIGVRGKCPHGSKCWLYFPEDDCPFYRTTVFSNYAEGNCPAPSTTLPTICLGSAEAVGKTAPSPGPYWSLMFEVSESAYKPVEQDIVSIGGRMYPRVVLETLQGAISTGLIAPSDEIVSIYHRRLEHGYPTPSLKREFVLQKALPELRKHNVWSRGRFGSYRYVV